MKNKTFKQSFRFLTLLGLMVLGISNAWGGTATATLTFKGQCKGSGTDDKGNNWTITSDAAESNFDDNRGIHYGTGSKAVSYLTLTSSSFTGAISKIVVYASDGGGKANIDVTVGGQTFGEQSETLTSSNAAYTFEPTTSQASTTFTGAVVVKISKTSEKKALYCKSIEVTYAVDDSKVVKPTFTVNSQQFFDPFDVEIATTTTGATIYYTLDGTTPTTASAVYSSAINISETTTLKAIAAKNGLTTSDVAEANYTLGKIYNSIEDLVAAGTPTTTGETVRVTLTNETITNKVSKGIFMMAGTKEIEIYCSTTNVPSTWTIGGTVSGTLTCPWKLYSSTWELCPTSWDDLEFTASTKTPGSITFSTYQSQLTEGDEDEITVTYNGDGELTAQSSNEDAATVSLVDGVLTVTAVAAGTTTISVSAPETEEYTAVTKSYTLTVKEPVQPASIPFYFSGGRSDIDTTQGMSQSGLDSDYASPNPPLKFKSTGAYVIVNYASAATAVIFNIKGNSFDGGQFDVLESANGTDYTTVATLTELAGTSVKMAYHLNANSRFVKFYYTNKATGNVGLGNIKIVDAATADMVIDPANQWATFYAPFAVDVPANVYAFAITVNGENEAVRAKIGGDEAYTLPAETPVLLYTDEEDGLNLVCVDGEATGEPVVVNAANSLVGTSVALAEIPAPSKGMVNYVLQNGLEGIAWYKVNGNSLPANRAFLSIEESVEVKGILDEATGISLTPALSSREGEIYNLAGQRVVKLQKGINIVNGKKVALP